jgi:hypothetical protein
MLKKVYLGLIAGMIFFVSFVFAEDLTITTYYPSPYGSYNQLSTNYLEYGTALTSPPVLGASCTKEGQTAYNSTIKKVYLCDGSKWNVLSGGTDIFAIISSGPVDKSNPTTTFTDIPGMTMTRKFSEGSKIMLFTMSGVQIENAIEDDDGLFQILVDGAVAGYCLREFPADLIGDVVFTALHYFSAGTHTITVQWASPHNGIDLKAGDFSSRTLIVMDGN